MVQVASARPGWRPIGRDNISLNSRMVNSVGQSFGPVLGFTAENFAVRNTEPAVLVRGPVQPGAGNAFQVRPRRMAAGHRLLGDGRVPDALAPHATPGFPLLGSGVAPVRPGR